MGTVGLRFPVHWQELMSRQIIMHTDIENVHHYIQIVNLKVPELAIQPLAVTILRSVVDLTL